MDFKNIQLNHMNEVEKLTENGFEIYENEVGAALESTCVLQSIWWRRFWTY